MDLNVFRNSYYRVGTGDIRFSAPEMLDVIVPGHEINRQDSPTWKNIGDQLEELGAERIGKARTGPKNTQKDMVYSVLLADWDDFVRRLVLDPVIVVRVPKPPKEPSPPKPTIPDRLEKLDDLMDMVKKKSNQLDTKLDSLSAKLAQVGKTIDLIDLRIASIDAINANIEVIMTRLLPAKE